MSIKEVGKYKPGDQLEPNFVFVRKSDNIYYLFDLDNNILEEYYYNDEFERRINKKSKIPMASAVREDGYCFVILKYHGIWILRAGCRFFEDSSLKGLERVAIDFWNDEHRHAGGRGRHTDTQERIFLNQQTRKIIKRLVKKLSSRKAKKTRKKTRK